MTLQKILAFIKAHQMNAWISNGSVYAEAVYCKDGLSFSQTECVGSTLSSAKNWLGY